MRNLIIIAVLMLGMSMTAQLNYTEWKTSQVVDEFNDPTGETASVIFCKGVFSNSATSKSNLTVKIIKYSAGDIIIHLYEYNKAPGASISYKSYFGLIKVKNNTGIVKIKTFAPDSGGLYWDATTKEATQFLNALQTGSKIIIDENDFHNTAHGSVYLFTYEGPSN